MSPGPCEPGSTDEASSPPPLRPPHLLHFTSLHPSLTAIYPHGFLLGRCQLDKWLVVARVRPLSNSQSTLFSINCYFPIRLAFNRCFGAQL